MHTLVPSIRHDRPQDRPPAHELEFPIERPARVEAHLDEREDLGGDERRGPVAEEEETDARERERGGEGIVVRGRGAEEVDEDLEDAFGFFAGVGEVEAGDDGYGGRGCRWAYIPSLSHGVDI